ncbi:MAG: MFS transporter [Acetobacterales bacterium]
MTPAGAPTDGGTEGRWRDAARLYLDRRVLSLLFLGFASGLPLLLTLSTLSVWMAERGVSKATIGLFAAAGLPYALKFAWAPLVDRLPLPLLTAWLGRRRGWLLFSQLAVAFCMLGLGRADPAVDPMATALWALLLAWWSATQDIVIDAYRVEVLDERRYGAGAATTVFGYRIGMLAAGAGALYIASAWGWAAAYAGMAALMGIGILATLVNPEPPRAAVPPGTASPREWLRDAVVAPLAEFVQRQPAWPSILLFVLLYKLGDAFIGPMANPFYVELGFSKIEIANVTKLFGAAATVIGTFAGGLLVARLGIVHALFVAGGAQALSNLMFVVQAAVGHSVPMLAVTIAVENVAGGMGTAAFVAYLSALCNVAYTATQYALLSSLMAVGRTLFTTGSGVVAEISGWVGFFLLTTALALPGLALLWWMTRRSHSLAAPSP